MSILFQALLVLLLVDLVSGAAHWAEDTFWTAETPVLGAVVITPNLEHHESPAAFVKTSYWNSNGQLLLVGAGLVAGAALLGHFAVRVWGWQVWCWQVWLFALVGGHANQIHKWAHQPRRRLPRVVRALQSAKLLQSVGHHNRHHGGQRNTHYCTVTPLLNPILDGVGVWRGLERVLATPRNSPRRTDLWGEPVRSRGNSSTTRPNLEHPQSASGPNR